MVNIVGLSEKEKEDRERLSKLVSLAKGFIPNAEIITMESSHSYFSLKLEEGRIPVFIRSRGQIDIDVDKPDLFNYAINLAEYLEKQGMGTLTVKKTYE
ncbi:hypothetical protein HYW75_05440 [Candidatus Pacearchaeota archaeon]|nr:hypothetical protein [Candidatus Pacearchaeota archaeon]